MSSRAIHGAEDPLAAPAWPILAWDRAAEAVACLRLAIAQHLACRGWHIPTGWGRPRRLMWWTLTLQMPLHVYDWVRARRGRGGAVARLRLAVARRLAHRVWRLPIRSRRLRRLLWWTLSLQLPLHAYYWARARYAPRAPCALRPAAPHPAAPRPTAARPTAARAPLKPAAPAPPRARLRLPRAPRPLVSVIIPTYGQVACTLRCLAAIAAHPPSAPIEVIVVDDASDDPMVERLTEVEGVRLIRHLQNVGYLHTCNAAAKLATGEHLLFLNNDTEPRAGWLDAMLGLVLARPGVGAVGAKLIYPDGRLQEAGGIIWNDASGWNYGRGDDPDRPEYNYVREVDYCSGAALLVPRAVFAALGGFDPRYAPAYFEDSDLAFRLRAAGYKVLYEPRAVVVHLEGASHGTDTSCGVKAYQESNRDTFVGRWADVLISEHFASGTQVLRARDRAMARPVVLVIDHGLPEPDRDAGSRTMLAFVQALLHAGAVVKFWSDCTASNPTYAAALQALGVEVRRGGWRPFVDWIREYGAALDHVLLSRPDVAICYLRPLRRYSQARVAFYGHDLHHDRMRQHAVCERDATLARAAERMLLRERRVWRAADAVMYPSQAEADRVVALEPGIVAHAVQPYGFADVAQPRRPVPTPLLLFVAGFAHPPNEDAACWLVRVILPLVRRQVPLARLAIVGSHPTVRVRALAGLDVKIVADVSDAELRQWYASARVAIVPLRQGAGVKRKVVEAMREGLPLVTTTVGAQGLPGLEAVASVCDAPAEIAASLVMLLSDNRLWTARSEAGLDYVRAHFSIVALRTSLFRAMGLPDTASVTRAPLAPEAAHHREPFIEVGDQVGHVLQPDMQAHEGTVETGAGRGAADEAGGRQRQALESAPGRADAEQRERLDERVGALH
jgi:GT2 family glycosyltransferase/glycosyltransferase involved in cell wall biosynthesis